MEEMKHSHEHHHDFSCSTEEHEHQGCGCHHHHHHKEGGLKSKLFLIGATIILLIIAVFIEKEYSLATWQLLLVYLIPYLLHSCTVLNIFRHGLHCCFIYYNSVIRV